MASEFLTIASDIMVDGDLQNAKAVDKKLNDNLVDLVISW